ncbi:beta-ketoacyl synthase N-terminal-like domain-containing protein [Tsukamurella ocularis]
MAGPDEAALRAWLTDHLVDVVGCTPDQVDPDAPVRDLGLGSTHAVVLAGELSELLGRAVPVEELFEHPSVNSLAAALAGAGAGDVARTPARNQRATDDAVAVIGMGCRFPAGIRGPEDYWAFLESGRCAVGEVPDGRWDGFVGDAPENMEAARTTTRWGAYLDDIEAFDAEHFGVSPNEAEKMDPQQRLLLEVAHEALEHAGIPVDSLARSATGVFAGACAAEYGYLVGGDLGAVDGWSGTGSALSVIANRVSYAFDLRGPSVTIDTACSSSLVSIHLACRSLRSGETDLAVAAGVNTMLSPAVTRSFDQLGAMSPTGRCHSFDAAADGYVRGEGCGVVVLKRLTDAQRDGDRVLAVVRGSAVNQDGRSNGLTAPNPAAQSAVLRAAYADAGIAPAEVDYVETHGTGTLLGDPIEARALGGVLGRGRAAQAPLLLGAVKANIGHLEAAAGVAGFIKTVLALRTGRIPGTVGYTTPNPHIPFDAHRLRVVAEGTAWPAVDRPRRAGVSSFGFGGTNAHVVLEQAPAAAAPAAAPGTGPFRLEVSAGSPSRVAGFAGVLADWLDDAGRGVDLADAAAALAHRRARGRCTGAVVAADRDAATAGLRALAGGAAGAAGVVPPREAAPRSGVVFVFSGQGSQWAGMGRRLLDEEPAFAAAVAELDPVFTAHAGYSLLEALRSGEPVTGIDRIQPLLVGVQLALVALWRAYGVVPAAVIGHSMGEVTAAVVAGGLTVDDGFRVICTRSRLMRRELSGRGAMALIEMDAAAAHEVAAGFEGVTVAVLSSPRQTVVAGEPHRIDALIDAVAARGRLARRVEVDVASHHATVDPILDELRTELAGLSPRTPTIPVLSTVRAGVESPVFDADYWCANLRSPVRFADAVNAADERWGTFVEVSPHPILTHAVAESLSDSGHRVTGTLVRNGDERIEFHTALAVVGRPVALARGPHVDLPATPWRHTRHWVRPTRRAAGPGLVPRPGTVLGGHVPIAGAGAEHLWRARIAPGLRPYPGGHRIREVELVPVSVLLRTFAAAAADIGAEGVDRLAFERPLVLDRERTIQVVADDGALALSSAPDDAGPWTRHATARLAVGSAPAPLAGPGSDGVEQAPPAGPPAAWGVSGTPYPWAVAAVRAREDAAAITVSAPTAPLTALLDAAVSAARMIALEDPRLLVPATVRSMHLLGEPEEGPATVVVRPSRPGQSLRGADFLLGGVDIDVNAADGRPLAALRGLRFAALDEGAQEPDALPAEIVHTLQWTPWEAGAEADPVAGVAVLGSDDVAAALTASGPRAAAPTDADRVVYVARPRAGETDLEAAHRYTEDVLRLVRELVSADGGGRLWLITEGAADGSTPDAAAQAVLWGLAGVVAAEHPQSWGGLLDRAPGGVDAGSARTIVAALGARGLRNPLRLRDGRITSGVPTPFEAAGTGYPLRCRPDAAYLVTGGMGGLGPAIAGWLADRGARRIVLAGRTALPRRDEWADAEDAETRRRIDAVIALERRGIAVEAVRLDVAEPGALVDYLDARDRTGAPPIRGVVHAAGVQSATLLTDLQPDAVRAVLAPKVAGARAIADAFPPGSVDFLHLVGSAGAVFGVPGQGAYAAANAYLDGLARRRAHEGADDTLALDWVAWDGMGFGADAVVVRDELARLGSRPIRSGEAFAAWDHAAAHGPTQAIMVPRPAAESAAPAAAAEPGSDWSAMEPADALSRIEDGLRGIVARELRLDPGELTADRPFADIGLNSVMAMSIRRDAEELVGTELSVTMLWNHPTLGSLAGHLAERVGVQVDGAPAAGHGAVEGTEDGLLESLFDSVEENAL